LYGALESVFFCVSKRTCTSPPAGTWIGSDIAKFLSFRVTPMTCGPAETVKVPGWVSMRLPSIQISAQESPMIWIVDRGAARGVGTTATRVRCGAGVGIAAVAAGVAAITYGVRVGGVDTGSEPAGQNVAARNAAPETRTA